MLLVAAGVVVALWGWQAAADATDGGTPWEWEWSFDHGDNPSAEVAVVEATVESIVDGDTLWVDGVKVRVIGIDTPEQGECGYETAGDRLEQLAPPGSVVQLGNPVSVDDEDRHGRALRYVYVPNGDGTYVDVGMALMEAGLAEPRYDSTDGYQWHPNEEAYRDAWSQIIVHAVCEP